MIPTLKNLKASSINFLERAELYSQLLTIEAKIESTLMVRRLIWAGVGAVFVLFAIAMAHFAIISYFWPTQARTVAIGGLLLMDIAVAALAFYRVSRPAKQEPFAVTKHQMAEDVKYMKEFL